MKWAVIWPYVVDAVVVVDVDAVVAVVDAAVAFHLLGVQCESVLGKNILQKYYVNEI